MSPAAPAIQSAATQLPVPTEKWPIAREPREQMQSSVTGKRRPAKQLRGHGSILQERRSHSGQRHREDTPAATDFLDLQPSAWPHPVRSHPRSGHCL